MSIVYAVVPCLSVCLCVCLSVTSQSFIITAKHIIMQAMLVLVTVMFEAEDLDEIPMGLLQQGARYTWCSKNL